MSRRNAPRPLGASVRALRAAAAPATLFAAVQEHWAEAVGEGIAAKAQPVRERDGTITVECRSATWAQELDLLQTELLERLNEALGDRSVAGLRMVVGESSSSTTFTA
jgi:predicted nucleic acid-binding Zn ribbon protein